MSEWLKEAVCKIVGASLHKFESCSAHETKMTHARLGGMGGFGMVMRKMWTVSGLALFALAVSPAHSGRARCRSQFQGKGYALGSQTGTSGRTLETQAQLGEQFYTRYIYNNGTLDTLNEEWKRYRTSTIKFWDGHVLKLTARAPGGLRSGGIGAGCCAPSRRASPPPRVPHVEGLRRARDVARLPGSILRTRSGHRKST